MAERYAMLMDSVRVCVCHLPVSQQDSSKCRGQIWVNFDRQTIPYWKKDWVLRVTHIVAVSWSCWNAGFSTDFSCCGSIKMNFLNVLLLVQQIRDRYSDASRRAVSWVHTSNLQWCSDLGRSGIRSGFLTAWQQAITIFNVTKAAMNRWSVGEQLSLCIFCTWR